MDYEPIREQINAVVNNWWQELSIPDTRPEKASLHAVATEVDPEGTKSIDLEFQLNLPTQVRHNPTYPPPEDPEVWNRIMNLENLLRQQPDLNLRRFVAVRYGAAFRINQTFRLYG